MKGGLEIKTANDSSVSSLRQSLVNLSHTTNTDKHMGFTIIEVLIVLAIAGLILLIVFLAVPALERSARNTQRKDDVGRITAAVSDFVSNNSGSLPASSTNCATLFSDVGTLNQFSNTCASPIGTPGPTSLAIISIASGTYAIPSANSNELILVEGVGTCATSGNLSFSAARSAVLLYSIETGSGFTWSCVNAQ